MKRVLIFVLVLLAFSCVKENNPESSDLHFMSAFNEYSSAQKMDSLELAKPFLYPEFYQNDVDEYIKKAKDYNKEKGTKLIEMNLVYDSTVIMIGDTLLKILITSSEQELNLEEYNSEERSSIISQTIDGYVEDTYRLAKDSSYIRVIRSYPMMAFSINGGTHWFIEASPKQQEVMPLLNSQLANRNLVADAYGQIWGRYRTKMYKK